MYIPHNTYEMLPYLYMLLGSVVLFTAPVALAQACGGVIAYLGYGIHKMRSRNRSLARETYYFEYAWEPAADTQAVR